MVSTKTQELPALRQELSLAASPTNADGSPAWTLYDPAAHRFYQLGWAAFEILSRWSLGSVEEIVAAVRRDTTLEVEVDDVLMLAQFIVTHELVTVSGAHDTQRLLQANVKRRVSPAMWLLKHYLFIRVPLIQPMPFLRWLSPWVQWLFRPTFWWVTFASALLGVYLASRQWDAFVHTFRGYAGWQGVLGIAIAFSVAKVLHELGHALTAYRYGCTVPTMGVALLVLWPVLYTDTNEAWKLRSRRERLHIGAAGVLAELALAAYATVLWSVMPDGPLRAGVFMLATSTWIVTLTLNMSPFTRFDGYFLLSDWLKVANLHERAFALTRWWLRERLFGFRDAPPEVFPPGRQRLLIAFSLFAWLYRFVLFFSIALLVFHFFFRALGLLLMIVEIGWFIVLPIAREAMVWWRRRRDLSWNGASVRTLVCVLTVVLILCVPVRHSISLPAVLVQARVQGVYAAQAAVIGNVVLREGQTVAAGAILAHLDSPDLDYQLQAAEAEEAALRWQVEQQPFDDELRRAGPALRKHWETAREMVAGLRAQVEQLTLRAPFEGRVTDVNPDLRAGVWLKSGERLFDIIGGMGVKGEGFVEESELARVHQGAAADFVADLPELAPFRCRVSGIDHVNLTTMDTPYAASIYGGPIPSRADHGGAVLPLSSTFRVSFDHCATGRSVAQETPGRVLIHGPGESVAQYVTLRVVAIILKEMAA
ncbi:MAG TPA: HlyD family efflux transporter periplasmic adaptor subunit [Steroidobacteraceae bacterium]